MPVSGDRVGEYVLEEKVGAGTFGEVWRAHHHVWADRVVAVKVPTDGEYVKALQREGTAVHGLSHVNIVPAINFDPYSVPPYLAMEFVPGMSLRGLLQSREGGRLKVGEAVEILGQVLAGLGYAHKQGVIHRDIKPENVLIHERALKEGFGVPGVVKLTDFGLGQKVMEYAASSIAYTASMQANSDLAGTLAYMSPEQRSGMALDVRSDLFSCGVMLFEMVVGERPAGTELPSELNPVVPKGIDDVFRRSYARLAVRYSSAEEFGGALAKAVVGGPPPIPVVPPPVPGRGRVAVRSPSPGGLPPTSPGGRGLNTTSTPFGGREVVVPCPKCRAEVSPMDQFCMACGTQLVDRVRRCTSCGAWPHPADQFCLICGRDLPGGVAVKGGSR